MVRPLTSLGEYRLLERISVGGMAEVYRARRADGSGRDVAIKRILPHLARDVEFVEMFIDEARTAAQLHHGNICRVHEFGEDEGTHFLVMELIEGRDLKRVMEYYRLRGRPPPLPIALHILSKTCDALDYAHRARGSDGRPLNIVHRDVTPQNILISFQGEVKLIDFGIAKAAHRIAQTQAGNIKGKLSYLAPELIDGYPATPRSDLFACGIVLHEVLTNGRLFAGDNDLLTIDLVRRAEVTPPSRLNPTLPKPLDAVVLRALARRPENRHVSAGELRDALDAIAAETGNTGSTSQVVHWMNELFAHDRHRAEPARPSGSLLFPPARSGLRSLVDDLASELTPSAEITIPPPEDRTDERTQDPLWLAAPTAIDQVEALTIPEEPRAPSPPSPPEAPTRVQARPQPVRDLQPIELEDEREVTLPRSAPALPIAEPVPAVRHSATRPPLVATRLAGDEPVAQGERARRGRTVVFLVAAILLLVAGGAVFTALLVWPTAGPGPVAAGRPPEARTRAREASAPVARPLALAEASAPPALVVPDAAAPDRPRPPAAKPTIARPRRRPDAGLATAKPQPPPPPPTEPAGFGFLIVASKPWARVWIDGRDTGRNTPIPPSSPLRLSAGPHRVTLRVEEQAFDFTVTIEAGVTTKLVRTLPAIR
jgi:serine/threonine protein kinase